MESDHPPLSYRARRAQLWVRMESDHVPLSYQESVLPMNYAPNKALWQARSGKRSTAELLTQLRRVPELNRRIEVLQTPALPLRQRATSSYCTKIAFCRFFSF